MKLLPGLTVRPAAALLACLGLLASAPALARPKRSRAPAVRPEDDPRLKGDSKAFANARVAIEAPADGAALPPAPEGVLLRLTLSGYSLNQSTGARQKPYALLLVDNDRVLRVDDVSRPLHLRGLANGPHALRLVLSRPWGEVVKARGAFALSRFWLGEKPATAKAIKAAEAQAFPDPRKQILTLVFPLPDPQKGEPVLVAEADPVPEAPAEAPGQRAAQAGPSDAGPGEAPQAPAAAEATPPAPAAEASPSALREAAAPEAPQPPLLDFYLSNVHLKRRGRGDKVRLVLDKKEFPLLREWKPVPLKVKPGTHQLAVDLLDRRGTKVRNAVNRTDRRFTVR